MIRFDSDYTEGCIPEILTALTNSNDEQTIGYGKDDHCLNAAKLIKQAIKQIIHFRIFCLRIIILDNFTHKTKLIVY